jgi:hypothetical protein
MDLLDSTREGVSDLMIRIPILRSFAALARRHTSFVVAATCAMTISFLIPGSAAQAASVTVSWTAPGDDGMIGQASAYDIRILTTEISDANWDQAQTVPNEPAPSPAGTSQSMTITVPTTGTWYVAMKTRDEAFNWSRLSNVVSFTTTDVETGEVRPDHFELRQNYPNPFNPSTTISFSLPAQSRVTLKVFNMLGQTVCTLVDRMYPAGQYSVGWDGATDNGQRVASGVYFYQLRAGSQLLTKSMTFLK